MYSWAQARKHLSITFPKPFNQGLLGFLRLTVLVLYLTPWLYADNVKRENCQALNPLQASWQDSCLDIRMEYCFTVQEGLNVKGSPLEKLYPEPSCYTFPSLKAAPTLRSIFNKNLQDFQGKVEKVILQEGYPRAQIYWGVQSWTPMRVNLLLTYNKGKAWVLAEPQYTGSRTRPQTLKRLVSDQYSQGIPEIFTPWLQDKGVQGLMRTGYFSAVILKGYSILPGRQVLIPHYEVTDAKSSKLSGVVGRNNQAGQSAANWQGFLEIDLKNMAGTARDFSLYWKGYKELTELNLSYTEPWLGKWPVSLDVQAEVSIQDSTYSSEEIQARWVRNRYQIFWMGLLQGFTSSRIKSRQPDVSLQYRSVYSALTAGYDNTDFPSLPSQGQKASLESGISVRESQNKQELLFKNQIAAEKYFAQARWGLSIRGEYKSTHPAHLALKNRSDLWRLGGLSNLAGYADDIFISPLWGLVRAQPYLRLGSTNRLALIVNSAWMQRGVALEQGRILTGWGLLLVQQQGNWLLHLSLAGNAERTWDEYFLTVRLENQF